jgi:methyl-accepting chemotaxis protein
VLGGLVVAAANAIVFYVFTHENYSILVDLAPMSDEVKRQLYSELRSVVLYLGLFSVLFVGAVAILALVLSHRAAGPIYRFKKIFDDINSGNLKARVKLRPDDDFQDVAESFNRVMDGVLGQGKKESG